jgi:hypothetical protein
MIILGFSLSALASVLSYLVNVTSGGYQFSSFQVVVDPLLSLLTTIAAVIAWYWLTQLDAHDDLGLKILRRAYLFFAIQYLLAAAGYNFIFTPLRAFGGFTITTALWLDFVGALVSALGLFLMSRSLVTLEERARPVSEMSDVQ